MTEIQIVQPTVRLKAALSSDTDVIEAMLVSTHGGETEAFVADLIEKGGPDALGGRINWLMKDRHGSPFEQTHFKFFVDAPIAVFREHHRHRIGWSYNEVSGRYRVLEPRFYIPPVERPLVQVGKAGSYTFEPGTPEQYDFMQRKLLTSFKQSYEHYQHLLDGGIAKEVARGVLPVYLMTSMYAACNARSMMAFLSLRTYEPEAHFVSHPMWEIDMLVARLYEDVLKLHMPLTWAAFNQNGRVAP